MKKPLDINGKKYIPSSEAAKITGYAPDYIGQLCRTEKIDATRVGRNWFVVEESLLVYKKSCDAMLEFAKTPHIAKEEIIPFAEAPIEILEKKQHMATPYEMISVPTSRVFHNKKRLVTLGLVILLVTSLGFINPLGHLVLPSEYSYEVKNYISLEKAAHEILHAGEVFSDVTRNAYHYATHTSSSSGADEKNKLGNYLAALGGSSSAGTGTFGRWSLKIYDSISSLFDPLFKPKITVVPVSQSIVVSKEKETVTPPLKTTKVGITETPKSSTLSFPRASTTTPPEFPGGNSPTQTRTVVIENPRTIVERVTERVIETSRPQSTGVTMADVESKLQQLSNSFTSQLSLLTASESLNTSNIAAVNYSVALTNKIDQLNSVDISNSTFAGGSISNSSASLTSLSVSSTSTFSGASIGSGGLKIGTLLDCDSLDTDANGSVICGSDASGGAGSTFGKSWELTTDPFGVSALAPTTTVPIYLSSTATSSFKGGLDVESLTAATYLRAPFFTATSSTATSTFEGGFAIETSGFVYDVSTNSVGIGTSSPRQALSVTGGINATAGFFIKDIQFAHATGTQNTLLGIQAGLNNLGSDNNTFVGYQSGLNTSSGNRNTFVGSLTGNTNTNGAFNTFMGYRSGVVNSSGSNNTFLGYQTGLANTTASDSTFIGFTAGDASTGASNTFVGSSAGGANTSGASNTFFGANAGLVNTDGTQLICIGAEACNTGTTDSLTNAGAIGYDTQVTASNSLILGNGANIGIGTTSPYAKLSVVGEVVASNFTATS